MGCPTRRPEPIEAHDAGMHTNTQTTEPLRVTLAGPAGETWTAIGGGETLDDAIDFAIASAPTDTRWRAVSWAPLFGD
jgi:hypothetical protein